MVIGYPCWLEIWFNHPPEETFIYWQKTDKKILRRINRIIIETKRNPFEGIGDPQPQRYNWKGYWSRRINKEHRFVYKAKKDELLRHSVGTTIENTQKSNEIPEYGASIRLILPLTSALPVIHSK